MCLRAGGRKQWKKRIGEETGQQLYINDQAVFNRAFHNVGGFTPLAVPENDVPPPVAGKDPHWDRVNVRAVYHMKRIPDINESTTIGTCSAVRRLLQSIRTSLALPAGAHILASIPCRRGSMKLGGGSLGGTGRDVICRRPIALTIGVRPCM